MLSVRLSQEPLLKDDGSLVYHDVLMRCFCPVKRLMLNLTAIGHVCPNLLAREVGLCLVEYIVFFFLSA